MSINFASIRFARKIRLAQRFFNLIFHEFNDYPTNFSMYLPNPSTRDTEVYLLFDRFPNKS